MRSGRAPETPTKGVACGVDASDSFEVHERTAASELGAHIAADPAPGAATSAGTAPPAATAPPAVDMDTGVSASSPAGTAPPRGRAHIFFPSFYTYAGRLLATPFPPALIWLGVPPKPIPVEGLVLAAVRPLTSR